MLLLLQSVAFYSLCCFIVPGSTLSFSCETTNGLSWAHLILRKGLNKDSFASLSNALVNSPSSLHGWHESDKVWLGGWSFVHTVLWVLISVLFCKGKALLPLSTDLADRSNCGCMSAFLRAVQSKSNLWKVSLVGTRIRCGFHLPPLPFDHAKTTQQCPDWYKQVKSWKAWEWLPQRWRLHDVAFGRPFKRHAMLNSSSKYNCPNYPPSFSFFFLNLWSCCKSIDLWNILSGNCIIVSWFLLSLPRCVRKRLPGDRRRAGDPLEQRHHPGLARSGGRESWGDMLGVLLPEAELQCRLESRRAMRASQVHARAGLPHHLPATAPSGVLRPPSAALEGGEKRRLASFTWPNFLFMYQIGTVVDQSNVSREKTQRLHKFHT